MTHEEAIRNVDCVRSYLSMSGVIDEPVYKALDMAIKALRKCTPRKYVEDGYFDRSCVCPECGVDLMIEVNNCPHCGQRILWCDELKPCPKCHSPYVDAWALLDRESDPQFTVGCNECGYEGGSYPTPREARVAWNRKVKDDDEVK